MPHSDFLGRMVDFLKAIGLPVEERKLPDTVFLPGVSIERGVLVFDAEKLRYPGDLLHEAGHLAVIPKAERVMLTENAGGDGGLEMAAIAWSYAAIVHLKLPVEILFHQNGYKGASDTLCENFANGRYIGVPILEWRGMTNCQPRATSMGEAGYPVMKKWLCD